MRMQVLPNGDLIANAVPVIMLLSYAYDVPVDPSPRLSHLPDWTIRERYDIEGKAIANAVTLSLNHSDSRTRIQQEIRGLLADRFRLAMRVENKSMSVYALTVARSGSKLQKSAITNKDCIFDTDPKGCHNFVPGFGQPTDLPVVNHTSSRGLFTVHTEGWSPMRLPPPPPNAPPDVNPFAGLPTIFTVLGKLGLELTRQEDILPVYTVENIKRTPRIPPSLVVGQAVR
jgi:uncharacterized protein (TIGR03435 family)